MNTEKEKKKTVTQVRVTVDMYTNPKQNHYASNYNHKYVDKQKKTNIIQ